MKIVSIFDNIDDIFEKHVDYLLAIPFISQLIFFFCMHFLGAMSLAGFINLGFLEKITPDIFIIHTKAEIQVFFLLIWFNSVSWGNCANILSNNCIASMYI